MSDKVQAFIEYVLTSGAFLAFVGRMMWHSTEVRRGKRRGFGPELFWELPVALGMGLGGEAVVSYFKLSHPVSTGVIVALAYLGPRGIEALFLRWFSRKIDG